MVRFANLRSSQIPGAARVFIHVKIAEDTPGAEVAGGDRAAAVALMSALSHLFKEPTGLRRCCAMSLMPKDSGNRFAWAN